MNALELSYAGAALARLWSFLSSCVLPLVPAYLCFLGGVSPDQLNGKVAALDMAARQSYSAWAC